MKEINDSVKIMEENKKRKGYGDSWAPFGNVTTLIILYATSVENDSVRHKEQKAHIRSGRH